MAHSVQIFSHTTRDYAISRGRQQKGDRPREIASTGVCASFLFSLRLFGRNVPYREWIPAEEVLSTLLEKGTEDISSYTMDRRL